jgi:predicted phosphohydrolase
MEAVFEARESADLCIISGDVVDQGGIAEGLGWIHHFIGKWIDTYVVLGNHDYFGSSITGTEREARAVCEELGMHLIANDCLNVSNDLRIAGGTLWTDFVLYDKGDGIAQAEAMVHAKHAMEDFSTAIDRDEFSGSMTKNLSPADSVALHRETVRFLRNALSTSFVGATVVVTHHAPHPESVVGEFSGDPLSAAFCSDLSPVIEEFSPELWIHGHTHASLDYVVDGNGGGGSTRIVCNPRAARDDNFDWGKTVEVQPRRALRPATGLSR